MEAKNQHSPSPQPNEEDVDLGQLFHRAGGVVQSFFSWLAAFFRSIGHLILLTLFFLRKNLLWLALGAALGIGYGFYVLAKNGARYTSEMTVRANYNSSLALYSTVDYLNALIGGRQTAQLSKIFNISPTQASTLKFFEVSPVSSELSKAELYRDKFLNSERTRNIRGDTIWSTLIKYPDFKNGLTKYDYPLHEIDLTATDPEIFGHIQQGLIEQISANHLLQTLKDTSEATSREVVMLLRSALQSLDTLRRSYSRRIGSGDGKEVPANNLTLVGGGTQPMQAPELSVYDKLLELKDELQAEKRTGVIQNDIVQVYSSFGALGHQESFFRQSVVRNGIAGLILSLLLVILIRGYQYLKYLENTRAVRTQSRPL